MASGSRDRTIKMYLYHNFNLDGGTEIIFINKQRNHVNINSIPALSFEIELI